MVIYGRGERSVEDPVSVQVRLSVFPRPSEVAADGETCGDRRREVVHVIGHADPQHSSAQLQGMCFMCTVPSLISLLK
jgi:hypothetical protein